MPATDVWYIEYADNIDKQVDSATINQIVADVQAQYPTAELQEVRKYSNQVALRYYLPDFDTTLTKGGLDPKTGRFIFGVDDAIIIGVIIVGTLATAAILISAYTNYIKATTQYVDRDPATGETVTITGYDAYLNWLVVHYPESAQYLRDINATNWWEDIGDILKYLVIAGVVLAGIAIFVPMISQIGRKPPPPPPPP